MAEELGIADHIDWFGWVEHKKIGEIYETHDLFLFPSLHDSGGTVVVEAISHGLPVLCLDLGGPGTIVDESVGNKVLVQNRGEEEVVASLSALLCDKRFKSRWDMTTSLKKRSWSSIVQTEYNFG